ncbi:MAG TPA: ElyC/SanA/YdcF family protein [Methylotenera sp.]|nr:ElyC/SanA/YdcF family protein [Methylotenera sp.]
MLTNIYKGIIGLFLIAMMAIIYANLVVTSHKKSTYSELIKLPKETACLVLGTSKFLSNGNLNLFYQYRMDATVEAFTAGKCSKIVVSGDNRRNDYNEPEQMKQSLITMHVPSEVIFCDYAGARTLDSVLRFKHVFGQASGIVISQEFHNERAIYIGKNNGINLTGFNAKEVDAYNGFRTKFREVFSRVRAVADVQILHSKARHYGPSITI